MDLTRVNLIHGQAQYHGQFSQPAFKMLNNVVVLYENLLSHLKQHGASISNLKYEVGGGDFSQANVNLSLLNFNALIKIRIEALEITFHNLGVVGEEVAFQILQDAWRAAKTSYETLNLVEQTVQVTTHLRLLDTPYDRLLGRFVKAPTGLFTDSKVGVVFYLGEGLDPAVTKGNVLLDQSTVETGQLFMQVMLTFDASKLPPESLRKTFNNVYQKLLKEFGLEIV
jgi:hypothetical protein